jgi:hypothetical protein
MDEDMGADLVRLTTFVAGLAGNTAQLLASLADAPPDMTVSDWWAANHATRIKPVDEALQLAGFRYWDERTE